MYSIDNSVYIKLRKHEDIKIKFTFSINEKKIPEIIDYYNILRFEETNKIDMIPKEKWDYVKK